MFSICKNFVVIHKINSVVVVIQDIMGPFKKYVTGLGGRGSSKIVTKCDKGGGGQDKE